MFGNKFVEGVDKREIYRESGEEQQKSIQCVGKKARRTKTISEWREGGERG